MRKGCGKPAMHLVIVQHGLWGSPSNTKYLATLLTERLDNTGFVLNYADNVKFVDHDGIDVCGERLFEAVKSTHDNLVHQGTPPTHISFIGYSAGGLIARYAAGRLFSEGYFDHVTPLNFVTVATPHLGSWRSPGEPLARLVNGAVPTALSRTGAQLFLSDVTPWGPPLLCVLTAPGLHFMAALHGFRNIVAMANVRHDRIVSFCSAAMQLEEPYPARGFEHAAVMVDPTYPSVVQPRKPEEIPPEPRPAPRRLRGKFLLALLIIFAILLSPLVPLMGLLLLLQGWLHRRKAATRAEADSVLQKVYDSWGGGGAAAAVGDLKQQKKQLQQLQLVKESQGPTRVVVDVETGCKLQMYGSGSVVIGSGTAIAVAVASGVDVGAKGAAGPAEDDRVPLHEDHLRQQHQQQLQLSRNGYPQELFAGLPPTSDKQGLQEWLATRLAMLQVRKVHVDTCNVLHAHSAIIVWNRPLFRHCADGLSYLLDACMVWA